MKYMVRICAAISFVTLGERRRFFIGTSSMEAILAILSNVPTRACQTQFGRVIYLRTEGDYALTLSGDLLHKLARLVFADRHE